MKHCRKCAFSSSLDVYDYATDELKAVLSGETLLPVRTEIRVIG